MNCHADRRQFLLGGLAAGTTALAANSLLSACSTTSSARPAGPPQRGGHISVGLTGGSSQDTLDPHQGLSSLDTARAQNLYESLVQLDSATATIRYVLATEMTPRNSTGTEWIIRLRPGVTFHDGKALTAADVVYTFKRIIANEFSATHVLGPVNAAGITALDKLTVLVPMTRPYATLPEQLAGILTAQVVPEGYNPKARPNGTGPFMYQSFTPGQQSVFTRNPHYWQHGLPHAEILTIIDFADTVALADALTTGQIHAAGTLNPPQVPDLSTRSDINVIVSPSGFIVPFTMRVDQPPFTDARVRQAMRLLVNRPQMIDSALDTYGATASDVFSPYDPDFDRSLVRVQDIPQAKFLLKQAGMEGLHVDLVTSPIATATTAMATVLAEQAKSAGVTISLQTVPPGTFFGPNYLKWTFSQDFYSYASYLTQVTLSMLPTSPWDETHFADPQYIRLYNQANATTSTALRKEIVREMQLIDFNRGGYIIPAYVSTIDAYRTNITGHAASRLGQPLGDFSFAQLAFAA